MCRWGGQTGSARHPCDRALLDLVQYLVVLCNKEHKWNLEKARARHNGRLEFGPWLHARDDQALGFQGDVYLGRNFGNDSSGLKASFNPPGYSIVSLRASCKTVSLRFPEFGEIFTGTCGVWTGTAGVLY